MRMPQSGYGSCATIWRWPARSAGESVAPFYIDLETPVPDSGVPKPGPLSVHLKDDHLQYAITWFMLAAAVVIAFGVWWRAQRRGLIRRATCRRSGAADRRFLPVADLMRRSAAVH